LRFQSNLVNLQKTALKLSISVAVVSNVLLLYNVKISGTFYFVSDAATIKAGIEYQLSGCETDISSNR
jgi:hypothetical protein